MNTNMRFEHPSLSFLYNEWSLRQNYRENQDTHFVFEHFLS